jgi:hypothetical protein
MAAYLGQRGWDVGGDDGAVLYAGRPPTVEPTYPSLRLTAASVTLLSAAVDDATTVVGKFRMPPASGFTTAPAPLAAVVSLTPTGDDDPHDHDVRIRRLDALEAHSVLFGSAFHHDLADPRGVGVVLAGLGELVETVPVFALRVPRGLDGLEAAEAVLREIARGGHT